MKTPTSSRAYSTWAQMKTRCSNPNTRNYHRYGGRGIKVCDRWLVFKNFLEDMGEPLIGMSLDRIDNDGNYEPHNCRWATQKQQTNNTSTNRRITIDGVTRTFTEWIELYKVKPSTARQRYYVYGWGIRSTLEMKGYYFGKRRRYNNEEPDERRSYTQRQRI
jgi:hypothetical protein